MSIFLLLFCAILYLVMVAFAILLIVSILNIIKYFKN